MRLLPNLPASEPESSLFPTFPEDVIPRRLLDFDESDSYSLPSESSRPLSTLDCESDLSNEGLDLSERETNNEYAPNMRSNAKEETSETRPLRDAICKDCLASVFVLV